MKQNLRKGVICISSFTTTLMLLIVSVSPVLATGSGHHHNDEKMSEHMSSMLAVKENIPEEYQIMERTPISPSKESLQQGRKLFLQNCSVCHGEDGKGKGPAAAALKTPPANFLDKKHSAIYGPGDKFWIIGHGSGETGMPAFPGLSLVDRWNLVNHIYQLQGDKADIEKHDHHH